MKKIHDNFDDFWREEWKGHPCPEAEHGAQKAWDYQQEKIDALMKDMEKIYDQVGNTLDSLNGE